MRRRPAATETARRTCDEHNRYRRRYCALAACRLFRSELDEGRVKFWNVGPLSAPTVTLGQISQPTNRIAVHGGDELHQAAKHPAGELLIQPLGMRHAVQEGQHVRA
jgi:hypothetical protein